MMRKYEAQGFVEALIAIVVTGIASMALLTIASDTLKQLADTELEDQLTQEAVAGGRILKYIIDQHNYEEPSGSTFFESYVTPADRGRCYPLTGNISQPNFTHTEIPNCDYQATGTSGIIPSRDGCLANFESVKLTESSFVVDSEKDDVFRMVCVHPDSTDTTFVAKIFTGHRSCEDIGAVRVGEANANSSECKLYEFTQIYLLR